MKLTAHFVRGTLIASVFIFSAFSVNASVIISEVAWMGTATNAADEWIELYNTGSSAIDITGWSISGLTVKMPNATTSGSIVIHPGEFLLWERSDDDTVLGIVADVIFTGGINNKDALLVLSDADGNEVERVEAAPDWPAGDNTTKQTMQLTSSGNWVTATGTPRATNANPAPPPPDPQEEEQEEDQDDGETQNTQDEEEDPDPAPLSDPDPEDDTKDDDEEEKESTSKQQKLDDKATTTTQSPGPLALSSLAPVPVVTPIQQPQRMVQSRVADNNGQQEFSSTSTSTSSPVASVAAPLASASSGSSIGLWITIVILFALVLGLGVIVHAQRVRLVQPKDFKE